MKSAYLIPAVVLAILPSAAKATERLIAGPGFVCTETKPGLNGLIRRLELMRNSSHLFDLRLIEVNRQADTAGKLCIMQNMKTIWGDADGIVTPRTSYACGDAGATLIASNIDCKYRLDDRIFQCGTGAEGTHIGQDHVEAQPIGQYELTGLKPYFFVRVHPAVPESSVDNINAYGLMSFKAHARLFKFPLGNCQFFE